MSILRLMDRIRVNPNDYIDGKSLSRVNAFIDGYDIGCCEIGIPLEDRATYRGFARFVEKKYSLRISLNWDSVMNSMYPSEDTAWNALWDLWDKYLRLRRPLPPVLEASGTAAGTTKPIDSILELMEHLRARAGMYIGYRILKRLKPFIDGYDLALVEAGRPAVDREIYLGFGMFVEESFALPVSRSWDRCIHFMCPDDQTSWKTFWEFWDEYIATRSGDSRSMENIE